MKPTLEKRLNQLEEAVSPRQMAKRYLTQFAAYPSVEDFMKAQYTPEMMTRDRQWQTRFYEGVEARVKQSHRGADAHEVNRVCREASMACEYYRELGLYPSRHVVQEHYRYLFMLSVLYSKMGQLWRALGALDATGSDPDDLLKKDFFKKHPLKPSSKTATLEKTTQQSREKPFKRAFSLAKEARDLCAKFYREFYTARRVYETLSQTHFEGISLLFPEQQAFLQTTAQQLNQAMRHFVEDLPQFACYGATPSQLKTLAIDPKAIEQAVDAELPQHLENLILDTKIQLLDNHTHFDQSARLFQKRYGSNH